MTDRFRVLLVDDGELDDVRDCLLAIGAEFAHLRGGAVPAKLEPPRDLFITSTRHATLARAWPKQDDSGRPVRIAVVSEDSGTLRATLRQMGFTFLVRRPVHPIALRLLLLHALYHGQERRSKPRVPLGYRVSLKIGMRRRDALLVDLGEESCRVLTQEAIPESSKVSVQVPSELCGDDAFTLPGRVVRCQPDRSSPADGNFAVAIHFSQLGDSALSLLDEALAAHQLGAASARDRRDAQAAAPAATAATADETSPRVVRRVPARDRETPPERRHGARANAVSAKTQGGIERRRQRRGRYANRVVATAADGSLHRVLIGRDLSAGGMRVDQQKDLTVGSQLRIALYDSSRETPVVVVATVTRDDGKKGLALTFENLAPGAAEHLEQLVASLPPVERLQDGETGALGTIVSEILG
jgi:hypothetical protein